MVAILPVSENPLSEQILCLIQLADGLAGQMLDVLHETGIDDSQLSGFGVGGQYIKLGVLTKLIEKHDVEETNIEKLNGWVMKTWEPAQNINLSDQDVRN